MPAPLRYLLSRALALGLLVAALVALRAFVAVPHRIAGAAMLPTLWPGDMLIALRGGEPARGDVVLVRTPAGVRATRVIGLPGERIALRRGRAVLNGAALPRYRVADLILPADLPCPVARTRGDCRIVRHRETAPDGRAWDVIGTAATAPATRVPAEHLLLLLDDRRDARPAIVPREAVIGRADTIAWSSNGTGSWRRFWRWGEALRAGRIMKGVERTPEAG